MRDRALAELLVLDLSSGLGGAYCSKLLADLGARVIVVEPPRGSALRAWGAADRAWGGPWAHLSGGKESAAPEDPNSARELLEGLSRACDVVILDEGSHWRSALPGVLPERVVRVELSPWGADGPNAGWRGSEIATWAMGGYMFFTGDPDGAPLMIPGGQSELHAGVHAAIGALTALRERRRSGHGQTVEISALESNLSAHAWLVSSWIASGSPMNRVAHDFTRTRDGWALFMRAVPNPNVFLLIDQPERMETVEITNIDDWRQQLGQLYEDVEAWAQDHDSVEVATRAQELRIACTPVLDAQGLDENIQLATRGWWEQGEDAEWDTLRFPGPAYMMSATPAERQGPAPSLGEHTEARVLGNLEPATTGGDGDDRSTAGRSQGGGTDGQLGGADRRASPGRSGRGRDQARVGGAAGDARAVHAWSDPGSAEVSLRPRDVLQSAQPKQARSGR